MTTYEEAEKVIATIEAGTENVLLAVSKGFAGIYSADSLELIKEKVKEVLEDSVFDKYHENIEIINEQDESEERAHKRSESLGSLFV